MPDEISGILLNSFSAKHLSASVSGFRVFDERAKFKSEIETITTILLSSLKITRKL